AERDVGDGDEVAARPVRAVAGAVRVPVEDVAGPAVLVAVPVPGGAPRAPGEDLAQHVGLAGLPADEAVQGRCCESGPEPAFPAEAGPGLMLLHDRLSPLHTNLIDEIDENGADLLFSGDENGDENATRGDEIGEHGSPNLVTNLVNLVSHPL